MGRNRENPSYCTSDYTYNSNSQEYTYSNETFKETNPEEIIFCPINDPEEL